VAQLTSDRERIPFMIITLVPNQLRPPLNRKTAARSARAAPAFDLYDRPRGAQPKDGSGGLLGSPATKRTIKKVVKVPSCRADHDPKEEQNVHEQDSSGR
jgi:hypothetical protein